MIILYLNKFKNDRKEFILFSGVGINVGVNVGIKADPFKRAGSLNFLCSQLFQIDTFTQRLERDGVQRQRNDNVVHRSQHENRLDHRDTWFGAFSKQLHNGWIEQAVHEQDRHRQHGSKKIQTESMQSEVPKLCKKPVSIQDSIFFPN